LTGHGLVQQSNENRFLVITHYDPEQLARRNYASTVQYSYIKLTELHFHNLVLTKQSSKTSLSQSDFHEIIWQSFVRTSHFLYFNPTGINTDKATFAV